MNIGKMMWVARETEKHSVIEKRAASRRAKKAGLNSNNTFASKNDCDEYCKKLIVATKIYYHAVPSYNIYF